MGDLGRHDLARRRRQVGAAARRGVPAVLDRRNATLPTTLVLRMESILERGRTCSSNDAKDCTLALRVHCKLSEMKTPASIVGSAINPVA